MRESKSFVFDGYGWACKLCLQAQEVESSESTRSRLFTEGEAETKEPKLSNASLAKWFDEEKRILICPTCGIKELIKEGSEYQGQFPMDCETKGVDIP